MPPPSPSMGEAPHLTLGIPVRDDAHLEPLRRTLEAIHRVLGDQSIEVLVQAGQDHSEGLARMVEGHPVAPALVREPDSGIYDAMNRLMKRAAGQRILYLGAGDLPLSGLDRAMKRWTEADDSLELGGVRIPDAEPRVPRHYPARWGRGLRWRNICHHQGMAYPVDLLRTFGGFPLEYPVLGDYALHLDMWQEGVTARWSPGEDWVSAAPGGVSRRFVPSLYREELLMKKAVLRPGLAKGLQPLWIRMKARWKSAPTRRMQRRQ